MIRRCLVADTESTPLRTTHRALSRILRHLELRGVSGITGPTPSPCGAQLTWSTPGRYLTVHLVGKAGAVGVEVHSPDETLVARVIRALCLEVPTVPRSRALEQCQRWSAGCLGRLALTCGEEEDAAVRLVVLRHLASRDSARRLDALQASLRLGWASLLPSLESLAAGRGDHWPLAARAVAACERRAPESPETTHRWALDTSLSPAALCDEVEAVCRAQGRPARRRPLHDRCSFCWTWRVHGSTVTLHHDLTTGCRRLSVRSDAPGPHARLVDALARRFPVPALGELVARAHDRLGLSRLAATAPSTPHLAVIEAVHAALSAPDRATRREAARIVRTLAWPVLAPPLAPPVGVRQVRGPGRVAA